MARTFVSVFLLLLGLSVVGCQSAAPCGEPWCASWTELATAVDGLRAEAEKANAESPDFPMAGMKMRIGGETLPTSWPVMQRFGRRVSFDARFKALENPKEDTLPGQPYMILLEMEKTNVPGFGVASVYPHKNAVEQWRSYKPKDAVRFSADIVGIAASDESAGVFGTLLALGDQESKRYLREPKQSTYLFKRGPYVYHVTMTNAQPMGPNR